MCGICGELRLDNAPPDLAPVQRMVAALRRRGPDDEGLHREGPLVLGHRRLAVIDLSPRAHQPMVDAGLGLALVFNGTIYNFRELRAQLEAAGYTFLSHGDTEVVLKAYHRWGEACVERLDGVFAFALWDRAAGRLFLARDRLGVKPLYYAASASWFRFASTLPALLAAGDVDTRIDPVALHHHLTLHAVVPAPSTVLQGVRKVAPATTMTVEPGGERRGRRYWELQATRPETPLSETEWVEAVRRALLRAVRRRMEISDVPVGVLLSGGLDSSLLVGLLAEACAREVQTFSIGFEDTPEEAGSEFEYSDLVAARFGTRHRKYRVTNRDVLHRLPEAIGQMAEPMVGQDAIAFYLLAEQVSHSAKVVQSGQGADEVFAGYFWYPMMSAASGRALERFAPLYFDRDHEEYLETIAPRHVTGDVTSALVAEALQLPGADTFLDQVLRFDVTTLIVDDPVKRVDNMTMAWGLEARVPFLDQDLVELAARMPPELKLRDGGKYVLRSISRGLLPDAVIDRPKGYFPVPALKYVRGPLFEFMRAVLTSEACQRRGLFQRRYLDRLLAHPDRHFTPLKGSKLWHLALLEAWLQTHVDRTHCTAH